MDTIIKLAVWVKERLVAPIRKGFRISTENFTGVGLGTVWGRVSKVAKFNGIIQIGLRIDY